MGEFSGLRLWTMRMAFTGLALMILLGNLLPLQMVPRLWAGPDLLFCFALAWSVRRAEFVPYPLLAALFLLSDFLLSRPPGLLAALMLIGCANMQASTKTVRDTGFVAEWARASVIILAVALAERFLMFLFFLPTPPLSLTLFLAGASILTYPIIVLASATFFGVRMLAPREFEAIGGRL